jgi:MFS family permease
MQKKIIMSENKMLIFCSIGGAFEFYDFSLFAIMSVIISQHFFNEALHSIALIKTFGIFAAGYIARFIGGFYFSHLGDTSGRKKPFMMTLFLMSIPTLGIALLPTYQQIGILAPIILLCLRITQGFALGGEAPCAMAFIYESSNQNRRCFSISILFGSILLGSFFASLVYSSLNSLMHKDVFNNWGWRIPFAIGGILGLIGIYLRKNLNETAEFINYKKSNSLSKIPFLELLKNDSLKILLGIILLLPSSTAFLYYLLISSNTLKNQYQFNQSFIENITTIGFFLNAISCIIFGKISDNLTAKKVYLTGVLLLLTLTIFSNFIFALQNNLVLAFFILSISITLGCCVGSVFSLLISMFAIQIRTSALALTMNTTNGIFVGLTPIVFAKSTIITNSNAFPSFYIIFLCLIAIISTLGIKKFKSQLANV